MTKILKLITPILMVFIFLATTGAAVFADEFWPAPPDTASESVYSIEISTGTVLYEKDADAMRYPASTTKILTCLLALENTTMDEVVTFSENTLNLDEGAVTIDAIPGEQMSAKDVIYGLMLESGNDCAVALAEHIAGSVPAFVDMMNARAYAIGCTGSHFSNPHGLFAEDHYTTAHDMALIALEAYKNSTYIQIISTPVYTAAPTNMTYEPREFKNRDLLIDPESSYYNPFVIGGKTGYLNESGRCLVTYAQRDDISVVTAQFKGEYNGIFQEAATLIDYDFNNFALRNASLEERRFSGTAYSGGAMLDPGAEILTLRNIPFSDLTARLAYADELPAEETSTSSDETADTSAGDDTAAAEDTSITSGELFGTITYSYGGRDLGSARIYLTKKQTSATPDFIKVYYINGWTVALFCIIVLIIVFSIFLTKRAAAARSAGRRRR